MAKVSLMSHQPPLGYRQPFQNRSGQTEKVDAWKRAISAEMAGIFAQRIVETRPIPLRLSLSIRGRK